MYPSARIAFLCAALALASCSRQAPQTQRQEQPSADAAADAASFATPEAAADALIVAIEKRDATALQRVLGPGAEKVIASGDDVADRAARDAFLARYREGHEFVAGGPRDVVLQVGQDRWPLPIPLVQEAGKWRFDSEAGAAELVVRRIGANELNTIDVLRGYVDAQEEYASSGHDGAPSGIYAQRVRSEPGKQNGLYWPVEAGAPPSPAGPFLAAAAAEGYAVSGGDEPYHGYFFRTVHAQGSEASGGERDYIENGVQRGGFALIAYPAVYGTSGVMTFMVNQDGVIWQRDLGPDTESAARAIQAFNPDEHWMPLAPESNAELARR